MKQETFSLIKETTGAWEMARQVNLFAVKLEQLSSIPRTHVKKGKT